MIKWPDKRLVVCDIDEATPIAYINVYEDNDIWLKIQGCEACERDKPQRCCGKCPFIIDEGCRFNFDPPLLIPSVSFLRTNRLSSCPAACSSRP